VGTAIQAAKIFQLRGVDELMILDIGATPEERGPDLEMVQELAGVVFSPVKVGGGIRSVSDVKALLDHGADGVVVNTAAVYRPRLIEEIASRYGSSTLTVSIDVYAKRGWYYVVTDCGKKQTIIEAHQWAETVEDLGAGEIVVCNIEREGTMRGYDLDLIRLISQCVNIPVVASGGCAGSYNMYEAIQAGASACAAGALFQFSSVTPAQCAEQLWAMGVETRWN